MVALRWLLFASLLSCGDDAPVRDAGDSGLDASDASLDAGRRDAAVRDGARDAAYRDAGDSDLGVWDAGAPEWTRVGGMSAGCNLQVATNPAATRPIVFEPCPDRPGCRQLRRDGLVLPGEQLSLFQPKGDHDGLRGRIPLLLTRRTGGPERLLLLVRDDGVIEVAVRTMASAACYFTDADASREHFAVTLGGDGESDLVVCLNETRACRGAHTWTARQIGANSPQDVLAGDTHVAVHIVIAETAWRVEWDGTSSRAVGGWFADETHLASPTAVANDATFFDQYGDRHEIRVSVGPDPGDPPSRVLVSGVDFDALGLSTDGRDMAWHQGYGRVPGKVNQFESVELWAAPFAASAEDLEPRRIARLQATGALRQADLGFGRWASPQSDDGRDIWIFDLSDGSRQTLTAPEGEIWWSILYLGPEEIAVAPGRPRSAAAQSTVMLVRYDSLGPAVPTSP